MRKFYCIIIILHFLCACAKKTDNSAELDMSSLVNIKIKPKKNEVTKKLSDIFDLMKYIPLETNEECIIGSIKKLTVYKDNFYILDDMSKEIICFDQKGKFKFKIDDIGKGPNEYVDPDDFSIDNDLIYVFDDSIKKIIVYNINGDFQKVISSYLYASHMEVIENRILFFCDFLKNYQKDGTEIYNNFLISTMAVDIEHKYLPFSKKISPVSFVGKPRNLFRNENSILVWQAFDDIIYTFNDERFFPKYRIEFSNNNEKIGKEIMRDIKDKRMNGADTYNAMLKNDYCNIMDVIETDNILSVLYQQADYFHFFYYSKRTKKSIDLSKRLIDGVPPIPLNNDIDGVTYYPLMAVENEIVYSIAQPHELVGSNETNSLLSEIKDEILPSNNPVIVLFKTKEINK